MYNFIIENVRCFADLQKLNIKPITFIVGENSTGKSTALGCLQTFVHYIQRDDLDFNREPYLMGTFYDIVRRSNPKKKQFQLGIEEGTENNKLKIIITFIEKEKGSEPDVEKLKIIFTSGNELIIKPMKKTNNRNRSSPQFKIIDKKEKNNKKTFIIASVDSLYTVLMIFRFSRFSRIASKEKYFTNPHKHLREFIAFIKKELSLSIFLGRSLLDLFYLPSLIYSFAPFRSKPQRTYNPLKEDFSPEGSDMPMVLMNVSMSSRKHWDSLKNALLKFGKASGLFTRIAVRRLGKSKGDPFQIQVKVRGPKVNLIDVGYGVNQILPILLRIFNTRGKTTFLMQQPEVHLHPKAQAELTSLMIRLAKIKKQSFIIETHSDYIIDRARIDIMKKHIKPQDVSLIYLEPKDNSVKVHNIHFDEQGNFLDTPKGYREFFLKESNNLLGF